MIRFALQKDYGGKKKIKKKDCVEGWIKGGESRSKKKKLPISIVIQVRNDESMNCESEDKGDR